MLYQRQLVPLAASLALCVLAACGGGGSTAPLSASTTPAGPAATPPAATPVPATATPPLVTSQLLGSAGFVNKQSHTVYVFDADLAATGTSTCNGQCATVWPAVSVPAGTSVAAPFGVIARADGTSQLTYAGRPLYTYIADSGAGSTAGSEISSFGATWHIARPAGGGNAPAPSASNSPGSMY